MHIECANLNVHRCINDRFCCNKSDQIAINSLIINYCDNCKAIIDYLVSFEDCKYWNPTLVYKNNRPMIYAANETLYEQLSDKLSDVTIATVIDLLQYGIEIDDTVKEQLKTQLNQVDDIDNTLDFMLSYNPTMDISDTDKLVRYINMIG